MRRVVLFFEESICEIPVCNRYWKKKKKVSRIRIPLNKSSQLRGTQLKNTSAFIYSTFTLFHTTHSTPLDLPLLFSTFPFLLPWLFIVCFDSYIFVLTWTVLLPPLHICNSYSFSKQTLSKTLPSFLTPLPFLVLLPSISLAAIACTNASFWHLIICWLMLGFMTSDGLFVPLQALEWQCNFLRIPSLPLHNQAKYFLTFP